LRGCGGERSDDGDVGEEFGGEMVALKQIFGRVEGEESFASGVLGEVLGDEDFEWEIKGGGGEASMSGVPALGLPKMRSLVGGILRPAFSASPLWSMRAKRVTPLDWRMERRRSTVWSTE
jgi:hypothetical protein